MTKLVIVFNNLNRQIYNILEETDYKNAIIDFISGKSDNFAIDVYNELISF